MKARGCGGVISLAFAFAFVFSLLVGGGQRPRNCGDSAGLYCNLAKCVLLFDQHKHKPLVFAPMSIPDNDPHTHRVQMGLVLLRGMGGSGMFLMF